jgi:hypothetical protein
MRSTDERDPGLGTGFSYFVPQEEYKNYIAGHVNEEEVSPTMHGSEAQLNGCYTRSALAPALLRF